MFLHSQTHKPEVKPFTLVQTAAYLNSGIPIDDRQQLPIEYVCYIDKKDCKLLSIFHSRSTPLFLDMEQYHPLNVLLPQAHKDSCAPVHLLLQYSQSHYHNAAQWRYMLAAGHQHDHMHTHIYYQGILWTIKNCELYIKSEKIYKYINYLWDIIQKHHWHEPCTISLHPQKLYDCSL